jgi:hypothetical protein
LNRASSCTDVVVESMRRATLSATLSHGRCYKRAVQSITVRLLRRAEDLLGGREALCRELQVPRAELDRWMAGASTIPRSLFLKAADLVLDLTAAEPQSAAEPKHEGEPGLAPPPSLRD